MIGAMLPGPPAGPRRCAIYTRMGPVSGVHRVQPTHDTQREACVAYARRQPGWIVAAYYQDHDVSGASMNRPSLQRLLVDVAARHVDVVLVHHADRLSRFYLDFATMMADFLFVGAGFVSVTESFSTLDPTGQRLLSMMMSFAALERAVLGARATSADGLS